MTDNTNCATSRSESGLPAKTERDAAQNNRGAFHCPYNDCGWCYCPKGRWKNDEGGQCIKPRECPQAITREGEQ